MSIYEFLHGDFPLFNRLCLDQGFRERIVKGKEKEKIQSEPLDS